MFVCRQPQAQQPRRNSQGGFRRLWRVLRQLFHEAIGALFAVLALGWLNAALRAWNARRRPLAHRPGRRRCSLICVFRRYFVSQGPKVVAATF